MATMQIKDGSKFLVYFFFYNNNVDVSLVFSSCLQNRCVVVVARHIHLHMYTVFMCIIIMGGIYLKISLIKWIFCRGI